MNATRATVIATFVVAATLASSLGAQQTRDPNAGSAARQIATVSGVVMSDESTPRPLRHARVTISGGSDTVARPVLTDDDGRFSIGVGEAGRYTLAANKPGYVRKVFGSGRGDNRGTPFTITAGQQLTGITLKLTRGGVIAGAITDETGYPAGGVAVRVMQYRLQNGERTLASPIDNMLTGEDQTDDRGAYRLFGLPAGDYVVVAMPAAGSDIRALTDADIRGALQSSASAARPAGTPQGPPAPRPNAPDGSTVNYAPVDFPGATSPASATVVSLGAGAERTDINFQLQLVHTARVEGTMVVPAGITPQSVQLLITPAGADGPLAMGPAALPRAAITPDGKFTFTGVVPGQYTINARTSGGPMIMQFGGGDTMTMATRAAGVIAVAPGGRGGGPPTPQFWGTASVSVQGQNVSNVSLTLQPAMSISGRVAFERSNAATAPPDLSQVRVVLSVVQSAGLSVAVPQVPVDPSGAFKVTGVVPGRYRRLGGIVNGSSTWSVSSLTINGRELVDLPLDISAGEEISNAVVTLTDAKQSVSGTLQDATGRPAPDYTILVFSSDSRYWEQGTRRVATTKPGTDGKFTIATLAAGDYRIAALTDVDPADTSDPTFLASIVDASVPFALAKGEKKVQDFRLGR